MITLEPKETNNINQMITISKRTTYKKSDFGPEKQGKFDHINRMITLSVIILSSFNRTMEAA
jgi:hypothetical protein